jgi:hypothetical protein
MMDRYLDLIQRKAATDPDTGLTSIPWLAPQLFPFQRDIVAWALRRGRAALFAGTGLGKSLMELAWGDAIHRSTGGDILLLTPLAVAAQMVREADKFGIPARHVRTPDECGPGINVTNYAKLDRFDLSRFTAIILDESSILKAQDGKTRTALIEACRTVPFRLAATATPAPNDFMELGNHAEFLGAMSYAEMLAMFFVHDGGEVQKWRLKGHAESEFWRWLCSWAVMLRKPSDLGYEDGAFALPPLYTHQHTVAVEYRPDMETGLLFPVEASSMPERIAARRSTMRERVDAALAIVTARPTKPWVVWCQTNAEQDALKRAFGELAISIYGSLTEEEKELRHEAWLRGEAPILLTKCSIFGYGLNWQRCRDTVFVGLNDSFEQVFQAVRRFWRFGQTEPVNVHFVASEIEGAVVANLRRKEADAERMAEQMVAHMADLSSGAIRGLARSRTAYQPQASMIIPDFLRSA